MRRLLKLQGRIREWQRQERLEAETAHLQARVLSTWFAGCGEAPQTPAEAEALVTEAICCCTGLSGADGCPPVAAPAGR